jgi:anthranilate synthase component 1
MTKYNLVPVTRKVLADLETPLSIYLKIGNKKNSFLLESIEGGEKWGRYSIIGLPASKAIEVTGQCIRVFENGEPAKKLVGAKPKGALLEEIGEFL